MKNLKVLLYTLSGIVAGIAIGILLAPSTGSETRARLVSSANRIKRNIGLSREEEFSDSEMEMDATNGKAYGLE